MTGGRAAAGPEGKAEGVISHLCPHGRPEACEVCPGELEEVFYMDVSMRFEEDDEGERYELFAAGFDEGDLEHLERWFGDEKERLVAGLREEALGELDKQEGRPAEWVEDLATQLGLSALEGEADPDRLIRVHALGDELRERMHRKVREALAALGDRRPEVCSFFVLPGLGGRPWWANFMEASAEELRRVALRFGEEVRWVDDGKTRVLVREALEEGYSPDQLHTDPDC